MIRIVFKICCMVLVLLSCVPNDDQVIIKDVDVNVVSRENLVKNIIKSGVYFYQVGQVTKLYIPNKMLFVPNTSQWRSAGLGFLFEDMGLLINSYDVTEVNVYSYVSGAKSKRYLNAIANRQAQKVVNGLLDVNIDARVITARGAVPLEKNVAKSVKSYVDLNKNLDGFVLVEFRYASKTNKN